MARYYLVIYMGMLWVLRFSIFPFRGLKSADIIIIIARATLLPSSCVLLLL